MNIDDLFAKDNLIGILKELNDDVTNKYDDLGSVIVIYNVDGDIKYRYSGSSAEIVGLLELGKVNFMKELETDWHKEE